MSLPPWFPSNSCCCLPVWFGKTQIAVGVFYTVFAIVLAAVFRPYEDRRANGYYVGSLVRDSVIRSTPV